MAITQTTVIREVLGPRSEGTGYNTLIRHYGVQNMRWLFTIISLFALAISVSVPAWAFDETHLKKLKALNDCVGCDLSKADLSGADLRSAIMRNAKIENAILCRTNTPWGEDNSGCKK